VIDISVLLENLWADHTKSVLQINDQYTGKLRVQKIKQLRKELQIKRVFIKNIHNQIVSRQRLVKAYSKKLDKFHLLSMHDKTTREDLIIKINMHENEIKRLTLIIK